MTLGDFEITPGIVLSNKDPENQGRIKACAPGLFDNTTMSVDDMLWVSPFMMFGQQTFSKLKLNSKIWILHNKDNYLEYWYLPMFEFDENFPEVSSEDSDVMFSRSNGGERAQMYYTPNAGFNLKNGASGVNLASDGTVDIKNGATSIKCEESGVITLSGSSEDSTTYSAVKGEVLVDILNKLAANLAAVAESLTSSPYVSYTSYEALAKTATELTQEAANILSSGVKIT